MTPAAPRRAAGARGQDLSRYGLQWSHFGLVYRDEGRRRRRVLHKLNDCGTANAAIHRQGLGEFFLDRPHRYEAAFVVPEPALQQQLLAALAQPTTTLAPARASLQHGGLRLGPDLPAEQSMGVGDLGLAAAPQPVPDRRAAQAWLRAQGYRPSDLHLSTATRLGARLTRANIAFDDHPTARRFAGHIETVTADSVFDWLTRSGRASASARAIAVPAQPGGHAESRHADCAPTMSHSANQFSLLSQRRFAPFFWTQFSARAMTTCSSSPSRCW